MGNLSSIFGGDFNTDDYDAAAGFEPIPAGWYPVEVEDAELKTTKAGTGKYVKVELTVIGEEYTGRKLFPNINVENPNAKAVEIGLRKMTALALACGLKHIGDTDELIGHQIECRVKIKTEQGHEPDNEVVAYRALGSGRQSSRSRPQTRQRQTRHEPAPDSPNDTKSDAAMPEKPGKRPWERR
jgi:hypothetical protein